jgi:DNA-binding CsgD family transcriptional regulator
VGVLDQAIDELTCCDRDTSLRLEGERYQSAMMHPDLYRPTASNRVRLDRQLDGATRGERAALTAMATEGCLRIVPAAQVRSWATSAFEHGLLDDHEQYASLWGNAAFPLIFADGFDQAARVSARAIDDARHRGSPIGGARAFAVSALLRWRQGLVREAVSDARTAAELGLHAGFAVSLLPLGVLVEALIEHGDLASAEAELRAAGRADGPIGARFLENWVLHARGRLRLAQGNLNGAIADLEDLGDRGNTGWRPWNPGMFCYRADLARAYVRTGDRDRAQALADTEVTLAERWGAPRAIGVALREAGLAAAPAQLDRLRASVSALRHSGAALELSRSLIELGSAIRRRGRRSDAREPLRAGYDLATRCGAVPLATRARAELVAAGARPRRATMTGVDSLTPSEVRVARLASEGLTNREIAQTLFVTLRTVQVHLTNSYRKLDIQSRNQLPTALAEPDRGARQRPAGDAP